MSGPQPSADWRAHVDNAAASLALNEPDAARTDVALALDAVRDRRAALESDADAGAGHAPAAIEDLAGVQADLEELADCIGGGYLTAALRHAVALYRRTGGAA